MITSSHSVACDECQRRKQKCNRNWPCHNCRKRKVPHRCHYSDSQRHRKNEICSRRRGDEEIEKRIHNSCYASLSIVWSDDECGFLAANIFSHYDQTQETKNDACHDLKNDEQYILDAGKCPQLLHALRLTERRYTDSLVRNFLDTVNYQYHIIIPPLFLDEYSTWWSLRSTNHPIGLQWTCLLLSICACFSQHLQPWLSPDWELDGKVGGEQHLTELFRNAARELYAVIPVGVHHKFTVLTLLYLSYSFQMEARLVECWYFLKLAIGSARELGFSEQTENDHFHEFELEIRRRVWCVLGIWDCHISALLSRRRIVVPLEHRTELPSLHLDGFSPSLLLHISLQSELIKLISNNADLHLYNMEEDMDAWQDQVVRWMNCLPGVFHATNPDKSYDRTQPWIAVQRSSLQVLAYTIALRPMRDLLSRPISSQSSPRQLQIREHGTKICLRLLDTLHAFFNLSHSPDSKCLAGLRRFVLYIIFDVCIVLWSVIIHGQNQNVPGRYKVSRAVDQTMEVLHRFQVLPLDPFAYPSRSNLWSRAGSTGNGEASNQLNDITI